MTDSMFGARDVQGEHGTSCHFRRKLSRTMISMIGQFEHQ